MKATKKLGVWMDHSDAYLNEFSQTKKKPVIIRAAHAKKGDSYGGENQANHKAHDANIAFYKTIESALSPYDEILLFGPTDAKHELANHLREKHENHAKKITIRNADKMSESEMYDMTRKFFEPIAFRSL